MSTSQTCGHRACRRTRRRGLLDIPNLRSSRASALLQTSAETCGSGGCPRLGRLGSSDTPRDRSSRARWSATPVDPTEISVVRWSRAYPRTRRRGLPDIPRHRLSRASSAPTGLQPCRSCRRLRRRRMRCVWQTDVRSLRQLLQVRRSSIGASGRQAQAKAGRLSGRLALAFDLGARLNHAGPNQCRIPGMPSLGEGRSGGARAFCLLLTGPAFRLLKSEAPQGRNLKQPIPQQRICTHPPRNDNHRAGGSCPNGTIATVSREMQLAFPSSLVRRMSHT